MQQGLQEVTMSPHLSATSLCSRTFSLRELKRQCSCAHGQKKKKKRKPQTPRLKPEICFLKFTEVIFCWYLSLFPITGQKDKWYIINVVFLLKWLFMKGWLAGGPFPQCLLVATVVFYIFILIIWRWPPEFGWTCHYFCITREHFFSWSVWQEFSCKPGQLQCGCSLLFFWLSRLGIPSVSLPCRGCVFDRLLSLVSMCFFFRWESLTRTSQMQFGGSNCSMPFPPASGLCSYEFCEHIVYFIHY